MAVTPTIAVLVFPGTNCEHETARAIEQAGANAVMVWHEDESMGDVQGVVVPGGFSYGDYLRAGVLARTSPVMAAVQEHAVGGGLVLGICNGFQILTEARLLPGGLMTNHCQTFVHKWQRVTMQQDPIWWNAPTTTIRMPIAHHQGAYYVESPQDVTVIASYADGSTGAEALESGNPNGSLNSIAGVRNQAGNVFGLMPHPERACWPNKTHEQSSQGRTLFTSMVGALA